ncbi:MAG: CapA family protein [Myxococcota bacterium]|nr:CapA family protein [Myxococcota bacterium]
MLPQPGRAEQAPEPLRLIFGGDTMATRWTAEGSRRHGGEQPFAELAPLLRSADLALLNLETALFDGDPRAVEGPSFRLVAPTSFAQVLAEAGVDLVFIANNHLHDAGCEGAQSTVKALAQAGIEAVGVAPREQVAISRQQLQGQELVILAATSHPSGVPACPEYRPAFFPAAELGSALEAALRAERATRPEAIFIVSLHWGGEYDEAPSAAQQALARKLIEQGAHAVIGHGSHTLQPVEIHTRSAGNTEPGIITYGLGNLLFDQDREDTHDIALLELLINTETLALEHRLHPFEWSGRLSGPSAASPDIARAAAAVEVTAPTLEQKQPTQQGTPRDAPQAPRFELWTIGPGGDLYERFGHSALRVIHPDGQDLLYNFGTTDFSQPNLVYSFITGEARFWLSAEWPKAARYVYAEADRSLSISPLHLDPHKADELARRLQRLSSSREESYYQYHHFLDNCATRIRDLLNEASNDELRQAMLALPLGPSYRAQARQGFADSFVLLTGVDLLLGRDADVPRNAWEAAFIPAVLEQAMSLPLPHAPQGLGAPPELLLERRGPPVAPQDPVWQQWVWTCIALLLFGFAVVPCLIRIQRRRRGQRPAPQHASRRTLRLTALVVALHGLVWGTLGTAVALFAGLSVQPEVKNNETLLWLWPSELLLLLVGVYCALRARAFPRWIGHYTQLRLAAHALVLLAHVPGWLFQDQLHLVSASMASTLLVRCLLIWQQSEMQGT